MRSAGRGVLCVLGRDEVMGVLNEGPHHLAVEVGRLVGVGVVEDETEGLRGERYRQSREELRASRFGGQRGRALVAGHDVPVERPRVRHTGGRVASRPEVCGVLVSCESLRAWVLRGLVDGVSARSGELVVEGTGRRFGVKAWSISRYCVRVMADRIEQFCERRWDGVRFAAIVIDGMSFAGEMMVAVLGITATGEKHMLGLRQGATEYAQVCKVLLESLGVRGVATDVPTLFVLDGA